MCWRCVLSLRGNPVGGGHPATEAIAERIRARRPARVGTLILVLLAVAAASALPAFAERTPTGASSRSRGPSVPAALQSLRRGGAITEAVYNQDYAAYQGAKASLGKLGGTRREELGAVLENVQAVAAAGELIPSRLGALFLTVERNRQLWTSGALPSNGQRMSFPPSKLVWQYYAGQGIEIQWLATFGEANGYYLSGNQNSNLRQVLGEALPLASARGGGIAWEYMFRFDGGSPPWTSGLSQGTAVQVYARAGSRLKEPAYLAAAQQALGIFKVPPPSGVRVNTATGALYAEYSYAPGDRILNGFIQALVGLYDYTSITKDPLGQALFEAGDAEARAEVPRYNTGAWSLYDQFGESNLNYHELLTEFLQHLCERTRKGPPLGGSNAPIPGDEIYCATAASFAADLHTAPAIALLSRTLPGGTRAGVQMSLSKLSTVQLTVRRGGRIIWRNGATVERGRPRLLWVTPTQGGTYSVTLTATDLAGSSASTSGAIVVARR
jgi:D-glucuronyl C5-epimerase C-terminus